MLIQVFIDFGSRKWVCYDIQWVRVHGRGYIARGASLDRVIKGTGIATWQICLMSGLWFDLYDLMI